MQTEESAELDPNCQLLIPKFSRFYVFFFEHFMVKLPRYNIVIYKTFF